MLLIRSGMQLYEAKHSEKRGTHLEIISSRGRAVADITTFFLKPNPFTILSTTVTLWVEIFHFAIFVHSIKKF